MSSLQNRTLFITGGSRGIGLAMALRAARDGANVAIAAKTGTPHPQLMGTIYSAARQIEAAGGNALPLLCDVRSEEQVREAVAQTIRTFGALDVCINNASAISLTGTLKTPMKRYDLMHQVNARGTFLVSQMCLPYLLQSKHAHILTVSPPLHLSPRWFAPHGAYSMAKYAMSLCVLGMAEEFRGQVAVNALWPKTTIATAAVKMLGVDIQACRKPEIMADAAHILLTREVSFSGHFCIDEDVLKKAGVDDLKAYSVHPNVEPMRDLFIE